jgi:hypothetical protein
MAAKPYGHPPGPWVGDGHGRRRQDEPYHSGAESDRDRESETEEGDYPVGR